MSASGISYLPKMTSERAERLRREAFARTWRAPLIESVQPAAMAFQTEDDDGATEDKAQPER